MSDEQLRHELYDAILQMRKDSAELRTTIADLSTRVAVMDQRLELALKTLNMHGTTLYGPDGGGGLVAASRTHDLAAAKLKAIESTATKALLAGVGSFFAMAAKWFAEHVHLK